MDHEEQQGQDEEGGDAADNQAHPTRHGIEQAAAICDTKPKSVTAAQGLEAGPSAFASLSLSRTHTNTQVGHVPGGHPLFKHWGHTMCFCPPRLSP